MANTGLLKRWPQQVCQRTKYAYHYCFKRCVFLHVFSIHLTLIGITQFLHLFNANDCVHATMVARLLEDTFDGAGHVQSASFYLQGGVTEQSTRHIICKLIE